MCVLRAVGGLQAFLLVALFVAAALGLLAHLFKHQLSLHPDRASNRVSLKLKFRRSSCNNKLLSKAGGGSEVSQEENVWLPN